MGERKGVVQFCREKVLQIGCTPSAQRLNPLNRTVKNGRGNKFYIRHILSLESSVKVNPSTDTLPDGRLLNFKSLSKHPSMNPKLRV